VRSERAGTASFAAEISRAVWAVNADLPVFLVRTVQELLAGFLAQTSFTLVMLAIAAAMALGLGVVGIYGVMAYVVSQRTREIGIRLALGAQPTALKRMFVLDALARVAIGAVVGLVAAFALTRLMASLLFGIGPLDAPTYLAALGVVLAAAGYPEDPRKGDAIEGLPKPAEDCRVFHAGTRLENGRTVTSGGRVLCVTALGDSIRMARTRAYEVVERIRFAGAQYRRDIGHRALDKKRTV
jgi:hypothetical protein